MALYDLWDRIRLRKTLASPAGILLIPGILFVTFFVLLVVCTFGIAGSDFDRFREVWERLAAAGGTLAGVGTFFIALTLGASFLTLAAQSEQLTLQKRELEESRTELLKAAEIQAKTVIRIAMAPISASARSGDSTPRAARSALDSRRSRPLLS
jgi:hypothetical protein